MRRPGRRKLSMDKLAVVACIIAQLLITAGLWEMYNLTRWFALQPLMLLMLTPALVQLILLLPVGKKPDCQECTEEHPEEEVFEEKPKTRAERKARRKARAQAFRKAVARNIRCRYAKQRDWIVILLMAVVILGAHLVFWKLPVASLQKNNYVLPVILAVLFVLHIAMEFWCKMMANSASSYNSAQLKGLRGSFMLVRIGYLLAIAASMLQLLGIYDATGILKVLLSILFVYETVFLAFTIAVRAIRKELRTEPEVLVSIIGAGSNTDILHYLEDNTGITMRSLWSLQLVKKILPVAIMGVALTVWLSTCVVQIDSTQQGALFRLGKLQPEPLQPGFHLTLPWPLDKVEVYDTKSVQKVTIGYSREENMDNYWTKFHGGEEYRLLLGGGEEIVSVNLVVQYRIGDLMQYIKGSNAPESILQAQAYEIVTARTISTDLDTLLAADREVFANSFRDELAQRMEDCGTGLEVVNVVLESIHPPVEIASIYQDIISAGIDAEYIILVAETNANETVIDAKKIAADTVGGAKIRQLESIAFANASVADFMAAVEADSQYSDAYRFQKYIQAIAGAYGDAKIIIVGEGVDAGNIYLGSLPVGSEVYP